MNNVSIAVRIVSFVIVDVILGSGATPVLAAAFNLQDTFSDLAPSPWFSVAADGGGYSIAKSGSSL